MKKAMRLMGAGLRAGIVAGMTVWMAAGLLAGCSSPLGAMRERTFSGVMPEDGREFRLVVKSREYSGDGTFKLTLSGPSGQDGRKEKYKGSRFTLRGMPGDDDATVWQCRTEDGRIFNFLVRNDSTVVFVKDV